MLPGSVSTFTHALGRVLAFWKKSKKADSLISYTQVTRVEPITVIDQRTMHLSYLSDILQSLNSIFAGYYLQAAAISCTVGRISVGKLLGHLNPDRVFLESRNAALECLVDAPVPANEDYRFGLPNPARPGLESLPGTLRTSMEDGEEADPSMRDEATGMLRQVGKFTRRHNRSLQRGIKFDNKFQGVDAGIDAGLNKDMREAANLSVGRIYTVELSNGEHKASVPVTIRLITAECAPELLVHILSDGSRVRTSTAKERWFGFKMKDLAFWRDIVACTDLIEEHKRALLKDTSGVYAAILKRRARNAASAAVTFEPSVGTASNIMVMSRQTVREIEKEIGGKFDNFQTRETVFEKSYLILVVVVDPDYDHVTIYHRGIELPTELSVRDLKAAAKGSGPDVAEILKAYQLGNAPSSF